MRSWSAQDGDAAVRGVASRQASSAVLPARPRPPQSHAAPTVDLLQSDLIRELQLAADTEEQSAETKQDLMSASEDAPIIRLANSILGPGHQAGRERHPHRADGGDVTIRFRIDGVLQVVQRLPKRVQLGLISRLKILSHLDICREAAAAGRPHQRD